MNMDKIKTLLDNKLVFNFQSAGIQKEVSLDDLPEETIAILLDYGTRKLNDKVNSLYASPKNDKSREELVERVLSEALEGRLGERRVVSSGNTGFRDYILSFLRAKGVAAKMLKPIKGATPEAIINTVWVKEPAEYKEKVLAELKRRYDESLKMLGDIKIDL